MEGSESNIQGMALTSHDFGELLNPSPYEIYKSVDWNTNIVFLGDGDGYNDGTITCLGSEFGNTLYEIEQFVERIIKGERAFSTTPDKRGKLKALKLAKYYYKVNSFLGMHSYCKIYTPHVELFFSTLIAKYGITPYEFGSSPDAYNPMFKRKNGEFFNQLVEEIAGAATQRSFKRKVYARTEAIVRGLASGKKYLDALFARYARLLVLRIDFGFRTEDAALPHTVVLREAQEHLARFFNNRRGKTLYKHLKGYIWRLEYGKEKGYHFHLFFFIDGSKAYKDDYIASEIGNDWIRITEGKGIYHNCNSHKLKYKRLGIGMIAHDDEEKRRNLLDVLGYLYKQDQTLREKHLEKTHGWGRGAMPAPPKHGLGRPRQSGSFTEL